MNNCTDVQNCCFNKFLVATTERIRDTTRTNIANFEQRVECLNNLLTDRVFVCKYIS